MQEPTDEPHRDVSIVGARPEPTQQPESRFSIFGQQDHGTTLSLPEEHHVSRCN